MQFLQQSEGTAAQRRLFFHAVDATDGLTAETGLTGAGRISKNGAATAASAANITEVDSTNMPGRYYIEFGSSELDTVGVIEFRYKAAACAEVVARAQVVPWDPYDAVRAGLTALPNANAEAAGGLYTRGSGAGQIAQTNNGTVDVRMADAVSHGGTLGSSTATLALSRLSVVSQSANTSALTVTGNGTGNGAVITSGSGATGDGVQITSAATNGNGLRLLGNGTGDGLLTTGGAGAGGDGIAAVAGGGVDFRGNVTGNITGNLSGSVGSVTGAVGSVTANVNAVLTNGAHGGAAATLTLGGGGGLTANITGNLSGSVGSVTGAVGSVTGAVGSVTGNVGGNVVGSVASVTGNVGGNVAGSVGSVTAAVTVGTNNDKTGYRLSATGVDDILDEVVDAARTVRQLLRGFAAALLGKASGLDTNAPKYRDVADTKDVISATTDANGNRTAVTLDLT